MDKAKKWIEYGKNILIVLLIISALLLAAETGLFFNIVRGDEIKDTLSSFLKGETPAVDMGSDAVYSQAAAPLAIVVTDESGAHHGIQYDGDALNVAYSRLAPTFGEALGSAGEVLPVSDEAWRGAISNQGVYFDFLTPQPLSAVASWLGTESPSQHIARYFCLACEGESLYLYYIRSRDGAAYRCETALKASALSPRLTEFLPDGTHFSFELDSDDGIAPYTLIKKNIPDINSIVSHSATGSSFDVSLLFKAFGMNSFTVNSYPEADGVTVYVEGESTLRVAIDGEVQFRYTGSDGVFAADTNVPGIIDFARRLVSSAAGGYSGIALLRLSYIGFDAAAAEYILYFDYVIDGVSVRIGGASHAVELAISEDGKLTSASLFLRQYTADEKKESPLPSLQAAAAAAAEGGGEPLLIYEDTGDRVAASWIRNN